MIFKQKEKQILLTITCIDIKNKAFYLSFIYFALCHYFHNTDIKITLLQVSMGIFIKFKIKTLL